MNRLLELDTTNYYTLLGIDSHSDDVIVQKAYRRVAMLAHPDRNPDNVAQATELFKLLTLAYDALKTAENRSLYNQSLQKNTPFRSRNKGAPQENKQSNGNTDLIEEMERALAQYVAQYQKSEEQLAYIFKVKMDDLNRRKEQMTASLAKKEEAIQDGIRQHAKWFELDSGLRQKLENGSFTDLADKRAIIQKIKESTESANLWADTVAKLTDSVAILKVDIQIIIQENTSASAAYDVAIALGQQDYKRYVERKKAEINNLKAHSDSADSKEAGSSSYTRPKNTH